jgi:hypothetical protein
MLLAAFLSQMNPFNMLSSLNTILMLVLHLCLGPLSFLVPSDFPTRMLYKFLISLIHATYPVHIALHNLVTLIIFGEEYKLWRSHNALLQYLNTSPFLSQNIPLSTLFWSTLCVPPLMWETKFQTHSKEKENYSFVYVNLYIITEHLGRQNILNCVVATTPWN